MTERNTTEISKSKVQKENITYFKQMFAYVTTSFIKLSECNEIIK